MYRLLYLSEVGKQMCSKEIRSQTLEAEDIMIPSCLEVGGGKKIKLYLVFFFSLNENTSIFIC